MSVSEAAGLGLGWQPRKAAALSWPLDITVSGPKAEAIGCFSSTSITAKQQLSVYGAPSPLQVPTACRPGSSVSVSHLNSPSSWQQPSCGARHSGLTSAFPISSSALPKCILLQEVLPDHGNHVPPLLLQGVESPFPLALHSITVELVPNGEKHLWPPWVSCRGVGLPRYRPSSGPRATAVNPSPHTGRLRPRQPKALQFRDLKP